MGIGHMRGSNAHTRRDETLLSRERIITENRVNGKRQNLPVSGPLSWSLAPACARGLCLDLHVRPVIESNCVPVPVTRVLLHLWRNTEMPEIKVCKVDRTFFWNAFNLSYHNFPHHGYYVFWIWSDTCIGEVCSSGVHHSRNVVSSPTTL